MNLLLSAGFFQNVPFQKNYFRNTIRVSNGLDPDQDQHSVERLENPLVPYYLRGASGCRASENLDGFHCKLTFFP